MGFGCLRLYLYPKCLDYRSSEELLVGRGIGIVKWAVKLGTVYCFSTDLVW